MRRGLIALAFLVPAAPAWAGVYNLPEVHRELGRDETRGYLLRVRAAALPSKQPLRPEDFKSQCLLQVEALEKLKAEGTLSTLDRVNLSGAYLRLDRAAQAQRLLSAGEREHFLVQSNLAAAYFLAGELDMAVRHQRRAVDLWPEVFAAWSMSQLRFFRECELTLLKLYRARAEEARRGLARGPLEVDPLFPGLRFVGPSGQYEAGDLAAAMRDRVPVNAFDVVFQLALWFPTDWRLYWLFGEMLNAAGSVDQAHDVFVELGEAGMATIFKDLPGHRRTLVEARSAFLKYREPASRAMLLGQLMLLPRATFAPPVAGDAAYLASSGAALAFAQAVAAVPLPLGPNLQPLGAVPPAQPVFNFRHVGFGFGFGFLVAALCALQWQEWRRRRQLAGLSPRGLDPVGTGPPVGPTSVTPGP